RLPTHPGDEPAVIAAFREGVARVSQQGSDGHRSALERRWQYRTGVARDSGATPVSDLAAARYGGYDSSVCRILRTEGGAAKLALSFKRGNVSGRVPCARTRQSNRHADNGCGDWDRQLQF